MLFGSAAPRVLGNAIEPRVRFAEATKSEGSWAGRRLLTVDDVPEGTYQPLLLQIEPRLVHPAGPGDYFAEEQVATWGLESFWGLPAYPRTPYYRTHETCVDAEAHLYEFVVPMVPPSWNERDRVTAYADELIGGATPTAVAVSILDVRAPAVEQGTDYYTHWALTHFLLDGHHKMQAAAEAERSVRLLSLLAVAAGLAAPEQVTQLPTLRAAAPQIRSARAGEQPASR